MTGVVLPLSDPGATLERTGGKGMSLSKLARAGLPVPPGFHVTTEAYKRFVAVNDIQPRIARALDGIDAADPAAVDSASHAIGGSFAEGTIPADIADAVSAAYASLSSKTASVAVRSSATAEDLPGASFAGQQETYLNIRGAEAVLNAVRMCWASLWTARAIAYRARQGIPPESVALAVVVQELVFADAAGIMFTANPTNGKRDEILINAAWGLGEAIVGGKVTPDTIVVDMARVKVIEARISRKDVMTVRTREGTREEPVPEKKRAKPAIGRAQAVELARLGARIAELYGQPMDIEWTLAGGRFSILQARPITALPEPPIRWIPSNPGSILTRMSFVEFVPDAVSPLFATLALPMASDSIARMQAEDLGLGGEPAWRYEVVNGYAFGAIIMKQSLKVALRLRSMTRDIYKYGEAQADRAPARSREAAEKWGRRDTSAITAGELLSGVRELFGATSEYFTMAQSWSIPRASRSEKSFSRFYDKRVKRRNDPPATTFLLGFESLALRAETSLYDLSQRAKEWTDLPEYLLGTPAQEVSAALQRNPVPAPLSGEFAARFTAHLAEFGHFTYDLDFSKPVPAEEPAPIIETLKAYLSGKGRDPRSRQQAQAEQRKRAEQTVSGRLGPRRREQFRKLLEAAQARAPERENAIADLGIPYPALRRLLRELGQRLSDAGAISGPKDVCWLEAGEVEALAAGLDQGKPLSSHAANVERRKAELKRARCAAPPNIVLPEKWLLARLLAHRRTKGNILKGLGASVGTVTAPACVLRGPEDFPNMRPGDVLVAVTTTPAWTPLFAMASAVVTDIGGPLSHSSIVAREYGIPAVMATGEATRRITSGQTVIVDGTAGTVRMG